ncbi:unnamed protein product [Hymenolepis diminuta]|uniref:GATOR2 complex protein WDR24 n=1 Tax=Hymenolepis diminuta TaxID=6216 RepID=A0A158QCG0_HYMDI|nr:unnamed protein product [Hymenolepis diminuta]
MEGGDPTRPSREPNSSQTEPERRGGAMGGMGQLPEVDEESLVEDESTATEREDLGQSRIGGGGDFFSSTSRTQYHASAPHAMTKKSWTFDAGDSLTCIATSNFFPLIAIAGRNLLQVLRVDDDRFVSVHRMTNLQRSIMSATTVNTVRSGTGAQGPSTSAHFQPPRSYAINDVAWSNSKSILGTCSNAGDLIIWDLSRGITQSKSIFAFLAGRVKMAKCSTKQIFQLFSLILFSLGICFVGHSRSVHRIHFNPNAPNEIISASHDGTVKLFVSNHTLAGAFENGLVCIWDTRFDSRPARSFQAHNAVTASIDWHPNWNSVDRNWLATAGGRDNTIMVWDLNKSSPTAVYSLRAKNTGHVRWRIGESTQLISSCSLSLDLSIHLWELNRPYIPYITFEGHTHTIAGISWSMDPNSFYSVARDGLLIRHYIGDGIQIAKQANSVALALNCRGLLAHALGGEPGRRIRNGGTTMLENTVRRFITTMPFRDAFGGNTSTAPRTPHQLLVTRRSILPPNTGLSEEERSQPMIPSEAETPPNIIPADDFIAQSQSELYVADFVMEDITELEAPMASLLLPDTFVYLAKNYRITGNSIEEVCDHNAIAARRVHQDFLTQFWLQLKQILDNCWQKYKPPLQSPSQGRIKISTRKGSIRSPHSSQTPAVTQLRPHSDTAIQAQRNPTYAEVAGSRSGAVCVLDFIFSDDSDRSRAIEVTGESASTTNKDTNSSNPTSSTSVGSPFGAAAASTSSSHNRSSDPDDMTGSLGRSSVNYLFSIGTQRRMTERQGFTGSTPTTITTLPEESDAFIFSSILPSLSEVDAGPGFTAPSEEEQFPALVPDPQRRVLDLTSSVNNVEPFEPTLISYLTLPLDFTHLVGQWFLELIEAGHAQTVCTALLIFGTERTRINEWATEKQIENWFYAYLDALIHFQLWGVCTRIIKHCGGIQGVLSASPQPLCNQAPKPEIAAPMKPSSLALPLARHIAILNQTGTCISVRCGKCAKPMQRNTNTIAPIGSPMQNFPHAPWACARHPSAETALSTCAVCHMTVRGIYLWCVGCSHGGHLHHIREWISKRAECPAGCGHYCEYGKLDGSLYLQISA